MGITSTFPTRTTGATAGMAGYSAGWAVGDPRRRVAREGTKEKWRNVMHEREWIKTPISSWISRYPWLKDAQRLETEGRDDLSLRIVYKHLNNWLSRGDFPAVDCLLDRARVSELSIDMLLAFLTVTLRFNAQLKKRRSFFRKVRSAVRRQGINEPGLLSGLG